MMRELDWSIGDSAELLLQEKRRRRIALIAASRAPSALPDRPA